MFAVGGFHAGRRLRSVYPVLALLLFPACNDRTVIPPTDGKPPAAVQDLAAVATTSSSITLTWTAPGDDSLTGRATAYDLRFSTAAITPASFQQATPVTGLSVPLTSGTIESVLVTDLRSSTAFYFALKTADEVPNWSGLSNAVPAATSRDTIPPAAITDLEVTSVSATTATLAWTAVGDDGREGRVSSYDVRFSLSPITEENFASGDTASGRPVPGPPGSTESMTVGGLENALSYYFALRALDDALNPSPLSNVVLGRTQADTIPPQTILTFGVRTVTDTSITLIWVAPGDDGRTGRAAAYDLRYSIFPLTAENWSGARRAAGVPAPAAPGVLEVYTLLPLRQRTTYYIALKAADEVPN
jgi:hypothetical protein